MTDLLRILPSFPVAPFGALIPTIERHALTTTDLLVLHPADIAKQTNLPILDLRRFIAVIKASLCNDLVVTRPLVSPEVPAPTSSLESPPSPDSASGSRPVVIDEFISTLDADLDSALGGGIPLGCITEFAGESGAGKTQFLLALCLAVQLAPPHGLAKQALYISTESGLATRRLTQMLDGNQILQEAAQAGNPVSLDNILSAVTPDLESQDHILEYQVPVLLSRHQIGLLVIDSVAANYRAEFERQGSHGSNMATRSAELVRLGALLRDLARRHNIAVVVANQVADRFSSSPLISRSMPFRSSIAHPPPESPLASRSMPPPPIMSSNPSSSVPFSFPDENPPSYAALQLDHQQRWITGWGDDPRAYRALKNPSLGLVWSTQIACRIALFKRPVYGRPRRLAAPLDADDDADRSEATLKSWRRWMKVVFAPHVRASGQGVNDAAEFQITMEGLKAIKAINPDNRSKPP